MDFSVNDQGQRFVDLKTRYKQTSFLHPPHLRHPTVKESPMEMGCCMTDFAEEEMRSKQDVLESGLVELKSLCAGLEERLKDTEAQNEVLYFTDMS